MKTAASTEPTSSTNTLSHPVSGAYQVTIVTSASITDSADKDLTQENGVRVCGLRVVARDMKPLDEPFETAHTRSVLHCAVSCCVKATCQAFTMFRVNTTFLCNIFNSRQTNITLLVTGYGYNLYSMYD